MGSVERRVLGALLAVSAATALTACSDDSDTASATSTSASVASSATTSESATSAAPAAPGDYRSLLIQPSDIGPEATVKESPGPIPGGDPGIGAVFTNPDGDRVVVVTLPVLSDEAAAAALIDPMKQAIAQQIAGSTAEPIDVGSNGFLFQGTRADTSKLGAAEISEVVFNQGRVLVNLEIDSAPGNPTSRDVILELARKQADVIKNAPPS